MKAFRGRPSIMVNRPEHTKKADLEIENLNLSFGGVAAIKQVDLNVRTGELMAVIGPNGAGKTSLLNCITGFYRPQSGKIFFNGRDITNFHAHQLVKVGIGRTFQNIELFPGMTVLANMTLARHLHCNYSFVHSWFFSPRVIKEEMRHRQILEEIIDFLEMQSIRKKEVGSLPYGMMKRVELGRALALEPRLLILDEPFAGMNLEEKEDMVRFLLELNQRWGLTMILVEHDMSIVMNIAQRIMVLNFGQKIGEGGAEEIAKNPEVIKAYLGESEII
ncbi:MAG TPA: ABC transporter ATP-binding protein [Smithellaceae bacterium]|jgi:branched-chain amino acid transport system ATP-binding protein|nr:MAG: Sulfate/thiosulfate import ATP-binding protein CysA [Deltaproteobacteria bacterium ADurb.BinA014]HNQ17771.1 ABC transporter ATP-binding protein [Smithellaceae bacterium]HNT90235.1 ABC transporter ATP-binding protein [Smithellaceae bacterium]HNV63550.1 ABC transporter ATP-binding protein [Smithellaceae bacterium]HNZ30872.1 ABC transporter ATP-binding protein [Smithellaceae bacterium]